MEKTGKNRKETHQCLVDQNTGRGGGAASPWPEVGQTTGTTTSTPRHSRVPSKLRINGWVGPQLFFLPSLW